MALIWNALVGKTADLLDGKRELVWYGVTVGQVGFGVLVSRLRQPTWTPPNKEKIMSYYAKSPYEEPEDPRCLYCDEFMVEIPDWFGRVWECRNPACEECSPKYRTQDNYWNPIEREWDTPEEDKAWESL